MGRSRRPPSRQGPCRRGVSHLARPRNRKALALKLLRALRLDASDDVVFERAAVDGEVVVSGAFRFWNGDPDALEGKPRQAFRSAFLGVESFGSVTLAVVAEGSDEEHAAAVLALAGHLRRAWGAPDDAAARSAAAEEIAFSVSLADHPPGTVVALSRTVVEGDIRERFRTLHRTEPREDFTRGLFRAITAVPDDEPGEGDAVDLSALAGGDRR